MRRAVDSEGFVRFVYDPNHELVLRHCRRMIAEADDARQEVFLSLYLTNSVAFWSLLNRAQSRDDSALGEIRAYVVRATRNTCISMQRKRGPERDVGFASPVLESLPSSTALPDQNMLDCEELSRLRESLAILSEQELRTFHWFYFVGLNAKAIGDALGLTVKSVEASLHRARRKVAEDVWHL